MRPALAPALAAVSRAQLDAPLRAAAVIAHGQLGLHALGDLRPLRRLLGGLQTEGLPPRTLVEVAEASAVVICRRQ